MASRKQKAGFIASPRFVFRSPLLPFHELAGWADGVEGPGLPGPSSPGPSSPGPSSGAAPSAELIDTLQQTSTVLRQRLRDILARPQVRDALFLASPDLTESLDIWLDKPDTPRGQKIERSVVRYFMRMTGRPTPFGLFSGVSVGRIAAQESGVSATRLAVTGRDSYRRYTRLDNDYLFALTDELGKDEAVRRDLLYYPNESLFRAAGRLRYAEAQLSGKSRTYHLVTVEPTEYLEATLERAAGGATLDSLAHALAEDDPDIALEEARSFVDALVDSQILLSRLTPAVTGREPILGVIDTLRPCAAASTAVEELQRAAGAMAAIDDAGLGAEAGAYRAIAASLESLPVPVEISRMFQVDMVKPAPEATLGQSVIDEMTRGVQVLRRITFPGTGEDSLSRFRSEFSARYEDREVPLLEVLDEEVGVGFEVSNAPTAEASPLLAGLSFPAAERLATEHFTAQHAYLFHRTLETLRAGKRVLALGSKDIEQLEYQPSRTTTPLPDAFSAMAVLGARSPEALAKGQVQILMEGGGGPSGANLSGRFCHASEELHEAVREHMRAEEALRPDAVFAEIVHLNQGRIGNILCRPVLRDHEIPFLGLSGAPLDQQIALSDLMVSVSRGRIWLRSKRLDREVLPRMTTAHNFRLNSIGPYRFLCQVQSQDSSGFRFGWGPLSNQPFLPRVTHGRLVFSRARWLLGKDDLADLSRESRPVKKESEIAPARARAYLAVQRLRQAHDLPRLVVVADGDNELPVDFDNVLSCDTFAQMVRKRGQVTLYEVFPGPDELVAEGPEGSFASQIVVSFVRRPARAPASRAKGGAAPGGADDSQRRSSAETSDQPSARDRRRTAPVQRSFPPGSEWLYVKLYSGTASADEILRQAIGPVSDHAITSGAASSWFFIRYRDDGGTHLRVRWRGQPDRLFGEIVPELTRASQPLVEDGLIRRTQLDTYEREVERYGGPASIDLAEAFFWVDSDAVLELLEPLSGDRGADVRWRLALIGADRLLDDLGLDLETKHGIMKNARDSLAREFYAGTPFHKRVGEKFRGDRDALMSLLQRSQARGLALRGAGPDPAAGAGSDAGGHDDEVEAMLAAGLDALDRRSRRMVAIRTALEGLERAGALTVPISQFAWSYVHMHVNRLLRSAQRAQELVLYDFLRRLYESQVARARKQSREA